METARFAGGAARVRGHDGSDARGLGKDNPTFRQVFTSRFIPGGSPEQLQWFNDLCLKTTSGDVAAALQEARSVLDISGDLGGLTTPTLVLHARDDAVCPIAEGRRLASAIPGAEFVELDSRNHILLEHEPAWQRFCDEVLAFLQPGQLTGDSVFAALSARERQVLALMADGLSNAGIAERLQISERPSATTRRICSTSSACGRGRRRSSSHASAATRAEPPTNRIGAR